MKKPFLIALFLFNIILIASTVLVGQESREDVSTDLMQRHLRNIDYRVRITAINDAVSHNYVNATDAIASLLDPAKEDIADVRTTAAWALGELESYSSYVVLQNAARYDISREVQIAAVGSLGKIMNPKSIPFLFEIIGGNKAHVYDAATNALHRLIGKYPDRLEKYLQDELDGKPTESEIIEFAVHLTANLGLSQYSERIFEILETYEDRDIVLEAIRACGTLGVDESITLLKQKMDEFDNDQEIQLATVKSILSIGGLAALDNFMAYLESNNTYVVIELIRHIGESDIPEAEEIILPYIYSHNNEISGIAIHTLTKKVNDDLVRTLMLEFIVTSEYGRERILRIFRMMSQDAYPFLIKFLKNGSDREQIASIDILHSLNRDSKELRDELIKLLDDPNENVAVLINAIALIGKLKEEDAVPRLTNLAWASHEDLRLTAIWALGEIGGNIAENTLFETLLDMNEMVYVTSLRSLNKLGYSTNYLERYRRENIGSGNRDYMRRRY